MALVVSNGLTTEQMTANIVFAAAAREHKLAARQVDGTQQVNPAQYDGIMAYLSRCPLLVQPLTRPEEEPVARHEEPQAASAVIADIAAGFYATASATGNNDFDFWKVTEGRRPGYRFVKRVLGGGDTKYPRLVDISQQQQFAALRAILREGIEQAADQYADNQERCKKCGAHLTDDDSRAARMGPVCRGER